MAIPAVDPKDRVAEYFDRDAASYDESYAGAIRDFRSSILQTRRTHVLGLLDEHPGRVLDAGSGPGVFTAGLLERGAECWLVDHSPKMLRAARAKFPDDRRVRLAVADVDALPFDDGSFDTVLCIGVLQYLPRADRAIGELARVTRSGGTLIVALPNGWSPLNWVHRAVAALTAALWRPGRVATDAERRLSRRPDIPNCLSSPRAFVRRCGSHGLTLRTLGYHGYHPPMAPDWTFPVLGPVGQWAQARLARSPLGWLGRDFIATFSRTR